MLQQNTAEDFVVATGQTCSVRDFCILAFRELGVELEFIGAGSSEVAKVKSSRYSVVNFTPGQIVVRIDPDYFRPTEVDYLIGDASKAKNKLGWTLKHDLQSLVREMIAKDLGFNLPRELFETPALTFNHSLDI